MERMADSSVHVLARRCAQFKVFLNFYVLDEIFFCLVWFCFVFSFLKSDGQLWKSMDRMKEHNHWNLKIEIAKESSENLFVHMFLASRATHTCSVDICWRWLDKIWYSGDSLSCDYSNSLNWTGTHKKRIPVSTFTWLGLTHTPYIYLQCVLVPRKGACSPALEKIITVWRW